VPDKVSQDQPAKLQNDRQDSVEELTKDKFYENNTRAFLQSVRMARESPIPAVFNDPTKGVEMNAFYSFLQPLTKGKNSKKSFREN